MIDETGPSSEGDERLAEQVADLAERIARGDWPDLGDLEKRDADGARALHRLLPAIRLLSELADEQATEDHAPSFVRPPEILGDFKLGNEIGRGGIGVVYEATQISLSRRVAVKVLPPASLLDPRQTRRFEIEAQAAALLQHPNIVPVFAYGNDRGVPYFAMRLIEGKNLAELVAELRARKRGGLPAREVAELGRQAAEALDYAHRNEVLHRDIKPSNFLVDGDQRLWIADFGLARIRGDSDLTASGDVLGTLRYLSPEQAKGSRGAVDGRSDVYALGATLFELLTLRQVFEGLDRAELLIRIVTEEPRFSRKIDASIPIDMKTIVLKALAKEPSERYATAGDMAEDLTLFLARQPIRARPPTLVLRGMKWARRHWKAVAGVGLMTTVMLCCGVAAALWSNTRLRAINEQLAVEKDRADHHAREAREQADTALRHALGAQLRLAAEAIDTAQPERAQEILSDIHINAGREAPHSFVWRYLWRLARREIVVLVGPTPRFVGMGLSPDGKILATSDATAGLQLWEVASGTLIRDIDKGIDRVGVPTFSPDSTFVAAPVGKAEPSSAVVFTVWEAATGRPVTRLPAGPGFDALACTFPPTGGFLAITQPTNRTSPHLARFWRVDDFRSQPRLIGEFEPYAGTSSTWASGALVTFENSLKLVLRDLRTGKPIREFDVDPSDKRIPAYTCSQGGQLVAAVLAGGRRLDIWSGRSGKRIATHTVPSNIDRLYFSPEGATLAAVDDAQGVHTIDRVSGSAHKIDFDPADRARRTEVAFSPDGGRLATVVTGSKRDDTPDRVSIWEVASGRRLAKFPGRPEELTGNQFFSPDGQSLFIASKSSVRQWRLTSGDQARDRQPVGHKDEAWSLAFSPDGRNVATGSDDSEADTTIKLWETATGRLTHGWHAGSGTVAALAFSPDGRSLASGHFESNNNVRLWEPSTGSLVATLAGHSDRVRAVAFAHDGHRLASASSDGTVRLWDVRSFRELYVLRAHSDSVHSLAFSADGDFLASAGNDGDVRLWDVRSSEGSIPRSRVLHGRVNLMAVAFAPDRQTLVVADTLGSMTIWNVERSEAVRSIHGDGDKLFQLTFTPDGSVLAAAGKNGVIRFWDPATGQELLSLSAHRSQINGLAFSPDGSTLGSVAHDGSVRLWRAEP